MDGDTNQQSFAIARNISTIQLMLNRRLVVLSGYNQTSLQIHDETQKNTEINEEKNKLRRIIRKDTHTQRNTSISALHTCMMKGEMRN